MMWLETDFIDAFAGGPMQSLKKINRIFPKSFKIKFIILIVAIIIGAAIETLTISLVSPLVAILLDNSLIESNRYLRWIYDFLNFTKIESFLALLAFSLASLYILRSLYTYVLTKVKVRFLGKNRIILSQRLLNKTIEQPFIFHANRNIAELQQIFQGDVSHLFSVIMNVCNFLADTLMATFILAFLFTESPLISSLVLTVAAVCLSVYFLFFRGKVKEAGVVNRKMSIAMTKSVQQALGGIKEVKVSHSEKHFEKVFKKNAERFVRYQRRYQLLSITPRLFIEAFCYGAAFFGLGFMFFVGSDVEAMLPLLSVFVFAAFRILPAITRIADQANSILYHKPALDAVYRSLFEFQTEHQYVNSLGLKPGRISRDIEIARVTFKYPLATENVLEDISLNIPENSSVAFIGPTGAGKTTLADIILGILAPQSGAVFYEGMNIHENPGEWSRHVGYIPQQIYILDENIRQNVAFGIELNKIDDERVWHSLELAQIKDFVMALPEKLDAFVGDRGIRLSGGQRQRIGIARALYRDPSILILDEATSSLDVETEKAVMEAISTFQGNKTLIIIAHRLSTIAHCDIVYRVEDKGLMQEKDYMR